MKKQFYYLGITIVLVLVSTFSFSATPSVPFNNVTYQVTEQGWAKTSMAKVVVAVDATLVNQDMMQTRQQIMKNLKQLDSKTSWHIVQYQRSQDASGLAKLQLQVMANVPADAVGKLSARIKTISKAGQKYTLASTSFRPSLADVQETQSQLRMKIYQQAKAELQRVNKAYPNQGYFVHSINFSGMTPVVQTMLVRVPSAALKSAMPVSSHITLTATVVLSSQVK